nr:CPPV008 hypothetical protein [Cooks petrelpox virus]
MINFQLYIIKIEKYYFVSFVNSSFRYLFSSSSNSCILISDI